MSNRLASGTPVFAKGFCPVRPSRPLRPCFVASKSGFGETNKRSSEVAQTKKKVDLSQELWGKAPLKVTPDYRPIGELSMFTEGKDTKVRDLAGVGNIVLYRHKGQVYASTVYSTAYQFPMVDALVMDGPDGEPVAEVPLDGTQYDLRTGKVLKWCPSEGNMVRGLLSMLKRNASPQNLKVDPTLVDAAGKIYIKLR